VRRVLIGLRTLEFWRVLEEQLLQNLKVTTSSPGARCEEDEERRTQALEGNHGVRGLWGSGGSLVLWVSRSLGLWVSRSLGLWVSGALGL